MTGGAKERQRAEEERKSMESMDIWGKSTAEEPFH
jgi:hypothetical protein